MAMTKTQNAKKPASAAKVSPSPLTTGEHGRYAIKCGRIAGDYLARAFLKPPGGARGIIAEARGDSEEAAMETLRGVIDAREMRQRGERRKDARSHVSVPSTEEFFEALHQVALTRAQFAMLKAVSLAGPAGLTEARIASSAGYKSVRSSMRSFGRAGHLIADYLSITLESEDKRGNLDGTVVLGEELRGDGADAASSWVLHEELSLAVQACLRGEAPPVFAARSR